MSRRHHSTIKHEKGGPSRAAPNPEEHDLAYYIDDRVELLRHAFGLLKYKDIKSIAPECVRHMSLDELEEICLEELLGISSKRLCAVLDGAEPPSDTESSDEEQPLETISLESISSDEEVKKKKHKKKKKRHQSSKSKSPESAPRADAGKTVLELLELQARARAIRARLTVCGDEKPVQSSSVMDDSSSSSDVLIKEEQQDIVEISSDEKPDVKELEKSTKVNAEEEEAKEKPKKKKKKKDKKHKQIDRTDQNNDNGNETSKESSASKTEITVLSDEKTDTEQKDQSENRTIVKTASNLTVTIPQTKMQRKIKLRRNNASLNNVSLPKSTERVINKNASGDKVVESTVKPNASIQNDSEMELDVKKEKTKKKKKKSVKEVADDDEILLELSETEKMDLLDDMEIKRDVSESSDSESDSDSSSSTNDTSKNDKNKQSETKIIEAVEKTSNNEAKNDESKENNESPKVTDPKTIEVSIEETSKDNVIEISCIEDIPIKDPTTVNVDQKDHLGESSLKMDEQIDTSVDKTDDENNKSKLRRRSSARQPSEDGEISESDEDIIKNNVIQISDEEHPESSSNKKNKKRRCVIIKDSNATENTTSDKSNLRISLENIEPESNTGMKVDVEEVTEKNNEIGNGNDESKKDIIHIEDDITIESDSEIFEISEDSSCCEVECLLSKEPTSEEIIALSAKIDEIDRDEVVTEQEIAEHEKTNTEKESSTVAELENVSWKDRYLDSSKVKKVLTTASILNALRKKNKELKKKMMKSNEEIEVVKETVVEVEEKSKFEEGSIEQYDTLERSTKYVDPVTEISKEAEQPVEITKDMKKDAKQLLKMYKRLLKFNDGGKKKEKDPNRKKKKKKRDKTSVVSSEKVSEAVVSEEVLPTVESISKD